jgi:hypothetical protein
MERYFVFTADLGKPLHGENPRGGQLADFDALTAAQTFAQAEKDRWDMVLVCERGKRGAFTNVERYSKGKKVVSG